MRPRPVSDYRLKIIDCRTLAWQQTLHSWLYKYFEVDLIHFDGSLYQERLERLRLKFGRSFFIKQDWAAKTVLFRLRGSRSWTAPKNL